MDDWFPIDRGRGPGDPAAPVLTTVTVVVSARWNVGKIIVRKPVFQGTKITGFRTMIL
jgi:hypothetical protein